jgi:hypothetical protein
MWFFLETPADYFFCNTKVQTRPLFLKVSGTADPLQRLTNSTEPLSKIIWIRGLQGHILRWHLNFDYLQITNIGNLKRKTRY